MSRLDEFRADPTRRLLLVAVGAVVGLALAWFHWVGMLVGGALVSLPTMNWKRGVLAGLGFGVLTLVVFAALLTLHGSLGRPSGWGKSRRSPSQFRSSSARLADWRERCCRTRRGIAHARASSCTHDSVASTLTESTVNPASSAIFVSSSGR